MRQLKIGKQITNRESESLERYLQEIGKVDLITSDEEATLAKRIRDGDPIALEKLTKANLRFVVSVAKQYQNRGLPLNDLINEGNVGLIKAGQRFDETRGFKFISYAVWWIRQSIMQALAEQARMVRLPLNRVGSLNKISRVFSELEQNFQREPTADELAEAMDTTAENIRENMSIAPRHVSMDAPIQQGEENTLMELLPDTQTSSPESSMMDAALKIEIQRVLSTLTVRESEVLILFYGLNDGKSLTLDEIGERFSITRERVRQIKEKATRHLRHSMATRTLKGYLG
ncbi:MAG: RNA polymerase sigma factor RpoD/SigA [Cyclobacteriaceae bacterium]|nr:RNA polymerase sigma factor RpoD/SigA [Cyclobacteriaceae bacterium]